MLSFHSWKDHCQFLLEYRKYSCLNCIGYSGDMDSGQFICMRTLSPVRLDLLDLCAEWQNKDGVRLEDVDWDESIWKISDKVLESLDGLEQMTFEDISELIDICVNEELE